MANIVISRHDVETRRRDNESSNDETQENAKIHNLSVVNDNFLSCLFPFVTFFKFVVIMNSRDSIFGPTEL